MKRSHKQSFFLLFLFLILFSCNSQNSNNSHYSYKSIDNGPFKVKTYALKNGLEIFLVPKKDKPRIETRIIVRAGSNQDPAHARGLAHYLEHLLFNGTDKIGAFNFEKERPLLTKIENLFEKHRKTDNLDKKKEIYAKIDSLSFEASKYSRQSEYSDLMTEMGIGFLNAFTRTDITGYMNSIPSNQLEKWLTLEAERFRNPVFRGFHTELETVYEEMNARTQNGYVLALNKLKENTFNNKHYQAILGTAESLKNPSLLETKKFYDTYYVPNNMAIILSGDFDIENAIQLIETHFGKMAYKALPSEKKSATPLLTSNKKATIFTPEKESISMYYVLEPSNSANAHIAEFVEMLFLNGNVGIVDIGDVNAKTNWFNTSYQHYYKNFSTHFLEGEPIDGISLKELEDIVLKDIDRLKTGEFPEWMLKATANDLNKRFLSMADSNSGIVSIITEAFARGIAIEDVFAKQQKFHNITKQDIMQFTNTYYNHYSIVYKRQGENDFQKLEKPKITAISSENNTKNSAFGKKIKSIGVSPIEPKLVDFNSDLKQITLKNGTIVNVVKNENNDLFNFRLVFDNHTSNELKMSNKYIKRVGTSNYSSEELKTELYKIGADFNLVSNKDNTTLFINGISKNLERTLDLVLESLVNLKEDKRTLNSLIKSELDKIENQKNNRSQLMTRALNLVNYGPEYASKISLTKNDLDKLEAKEILQQVSRLFNRKQEIYFYGSKNSEALFEIFNKKFNNDIVFVNNESVVTKIKNQNNTNNVYLVDYNGKQVDISFTGQLDTFNKNKHGMYILFENYFDQVINEQIRETKGLAYNAYNTIEYPKYNYSNYYHYTSVGTQTDKFEETLSINKNLIENLPIEESTFKTVKKRLETLWGSGRITKNSILYHYERAKNRGLDYDYRAHYIKGISDVTLEDFQKFYEESIKKHNYNLILIGDLNEIDRSKLSKYGKNIELSKETLFGED